MFLLKSPYVSTLPGISNSKGHVLAFGKTELFCKTVISEGLNPIGGITRQPVENISKPGSLVAIKIKINMHHTILSVLKMLIKCIN